MTEASIYQELYELLCNLNSVDLQKIPKLLLKEIDLNRDRNYQTRIDVSDLYNPDNISKEALEMYMELDYKYIMTDEEKKELEGDN